MADNLLCRMVNGRDGYMDKMVRDGEDGREGHYGFLGTVLGDHRYHIDHPTIRLGYLELIS